jgi:hypothetical protein
VRSVAVILFTLLLALPAVSVELFRYCGAARDGGTLEYVFDSDARSVLQTVTKEKVVEIAADFMTTYYGVQVGALETQELRQQPTVLARVLLGHRQRIFTAIVLCHCLAGWDDR